MAAMLLTVQPETDDEPVRMDWRRSGARNRRRYSVGADLTASTLLRLTEEFSNAEDDPQPCDVGDPLAYHMAREALREARRLRGRLGVRQREPDVVTIIAPGIIRALIRFAGIWIARIILRFGNWLAGIALVQIDKADRNKRQWPVSTCRLDCL